MLSPKSKDFLKNRCVLICVDMCYFTLTTEITTSKILGDAIRYTIQHYLLSTQEKVRRFPLN